MDTAGKLTEAIVKIRDRLLSEGIASAAEINAGRCTCVVSDVAEELGGLDAFYEHGMSELGIDQLMIVEDGEPSGFDRDLIADHWKDFVPPEGLNWDDMDAIAAYGNFSAGTHEWIVMDGRHYDAEAPAGVDNPFDLPFFQRIVAAWREETTPRGPSA